MNIAVRYYTRSGNAKKLAEAVADAVAVEAKDVSVALEDKAEILFLCCSYYAFDVDEAVKKFIVNNKDFIGKIVCCGTSAMMRSMRKPVSRVTDSVGLPVLKEEFHCRGAFGPAHKGRPNEKDLKQAADFAKKMIK